MEWDAAFIKPTVGYQSISYNLDESLTLPGDESPSVGAAMVNLDAGYFLERDTSLFGTAFLQTLEPRAFYLWVDREDHSDLPNFDSSDLTFSFSQLFRTTRFSGRDRIADANQASSSGDSVAVTNSTTPSAAIQCRSPSDGSGMAARLRSSAHARQNASPELLLVYGPPSYNTVPMELVISHVMSAP